jgi:pimeloyl-ACP methyl ester carboxylesterase
MQRFLAGTVLLAALVLAAPATAATVPKGPDGLDFYKTPSTFPKGHGTPIYWRKLTGEAVLKNAASNRLLLYRSESVDGDAVAVSGTVAVPKGKAPKGGWPVVTWAHATVGIADACAPSIAGMPASYDSPLLQKWLKAGFAVVRTDYEGLGVPDITHPYLIGVSEGRGVLDIVRAARKLDAKIGKRVVIAGHSQGGQAALWAASLARKWTPELTVRGTLALAPVSHLGELAPVLSALTQPGGLTGLAALILRGVDVAKPSLNVGNLLSERAKALYPQVDTACLTDLDEPTSFGGLAPADLFAPGANLSGVDATLSANDAETLKIPGTVQIEQGSADTTVIPGPTADLVAQLKKRGATVTYKTYNGVDHAGVVTKSAPAKAATSFVKSRVR